MIPLSTFNLLIIVDILFIIYAVIDHRNRLYANIIMAFIAGLLSAFLATAIMNHIVYDGLLMTTQSCSPCLVADIPSVGYFLYLLSTIMFIYTMVMIYEVINEAFEKKVIDAKEKEGGGE